MKKLIIFFAAATMALFNACDEISPEVTGAMGGGGNTSPVDDQLRQVIIEEFTGVRCVQCPAGSVAIQELLAIHGERLVAVSIHAGDFSPPYSSSQYDFRTEEGSELLNYLPTVFGYPSASVNRKVFDGQFDVQLDQLDWAGSIQAELAVAPKVRINIEPEYDEPNRELTVDVTLYVDEAITEPDVRLSLMITENDIVDLQLTPASSTPQADYVHRHVLRGMLTNYDGNPITEQLSAGATIKKQFTYTLPAEWNPAHCEVVALVGLAGASKEVLQAHQVHLVE